MQGKLLLILCAVRAEGYHSDPNFIYNSAFDSRYQRLAPGQLAREERLSEAPRYPFLPFSDAYVKKALAEPTNWTALGAVTPVKDQGPHGFCGTFGRVGSAEGQWALKGNALTSFSEQMLVSCIGWDADQFSYFSPRGFMTSQDYPYNETN
jgi:C1A family cysteine protease